MTGMIKLTFLHNFLSRSDSRVLQASMQIAQAYASATKCVCETGIILPEKQRGGILQYHVEVSS
jgi:hypothetical protein